MMFLLFFDDITSERELKYTLTGCLQSPSGRLPVVQTIWIIDRGEEIPRLVTAYPHEE